jgi:hypothetical protein
MLLHRMAKLFTSKIEEPDMMVIELGYRNFVLPTSDAVQILQLLEKAEIYENKYDDGAYTHHVYANDQPIAAKLIGDDLYRMAKLAGKSGA